MVSVLEHSYRGRPDREYLPQANALWFQILREASRVPCHRFQNLCKTIPLARNFWCPTPPVRGHCVFGKQMSDLDLASHWPMRIYKVCRIFPHCPIEHRMKMDF
jgi:hypothetical protein